MTCNLPDHALVVEAMLEGFVLACQVCIEAGLAPPDPTDTDVLYRLEPPGEEDWKLPQGVIKDGWGDCEDLAGWRAGGMRATGVDPGARVIVVSTGKHKLHAVVLTSDGEILDPSIELIRRQGGKNTSPTTVGAWSGLLSFLNKKKQPPKAPYVDRGGGGRDHRKPRKSSDDGSGLPAAADPTAPWNEDAYQKHQQLSRDLDKKLDTNKPFDLDVDQSQQQVQPQYADQSQQQPQYADQSQPQYDDQGGDGGDGGGGFFDDFLPASVDSSSDDLFADTLWDGAA